MGGDDGGTGGGVVGGERICGVSRIIGKGEGKGVISIPRGLADLVAG